MKKKRLQGEDGMMVVEATLSFTVFVMVVAAIIYLISIFMVHNKIQFAINSAAHEIASYSYLYAALGLSDVEATLDADGSAHTAPIDDTVNQVVDSLNQIENLGGSIGGTVDSVQNIELSSDYITGVRDQVSQLKSDAQSTSDSVKQSAADLKSLFSDPKSLLVGLIYIGAYEVGYSAKSAIATAAATGLTEKYLVQGNQSADDYLRSLGITDGYAGLDFSGSTLFCEEKDGSGRIVDIVVSYDIDMSFLNLIMPDPKVHMIQRVSVAGWTKGDGEELSDYGIEKV